VSGSICKIEPDTQVTIQYKKKLSKLASNNPCPFAMSKYHEISLYGGL
jgi:hypothetical protein